MRIKQTVKTIVLACSILLASIVALTPSVALAQAKVIPSGSASSACDPDTENCCGGIQTSVITCKETGGDNADIQNTGIWGILLLGINILTAGVGVTAVAGLVYAGIMYSSSAGEPEKAKKAITMISNIVIGLLAFALMYAGLNFLVPGGLFN